ncbi:F-box protein At3g07870-like [Nicotiana tabacum]|uniref:F-box protein At3g07870-like n=2 Tax=Nicotiana tabacum TaxID=4097 RepID=A0A1S4CME0_TOBAC|nr:PREDICTED: F-box protein At3g07870-like [Nicotiana tabacum]XP_016502300.1 PREDICTED: F-box protein At3g07870-like [Nicotiana tabacum]XP_016502301.1 PREDICTED: F-box protein At3g07870-like [Nicotiana tabacum]XP_016502302.1 PREDICTED: F-box protein At3g07870-like [Nicotiana tabacum]XP_016502303.1 PREDICTED: F-box protein At3g07870-like [Nicotiana tabacum]XP_016502304.1 PREDICTED: F-box protein At3g07870-like [Nicotiana tabacum]
MRDRWPRGKKWLKLSSVETIALEQLRRSSTSRETKQEMKNNLETKGTWLPYDLLFKVFLLLPAETLCRLRCVCRTLLNMINSPAFVEAHFRQSETVLITQKSFREENIRSPFPLPSDKPNQCYFHFWDIHSGEGHKVCMPNLRNLECVLAACNGLVLARIKKNGGLVVVNPSTRNHIRMPLGTIGFAQECYGFMFSHFTGAYKVVHLFRDEHRHIRCEILNLTTRSWHAVDGPNSGEFGSISTTRRSVSAVGALYWLPKRDSCNHVVSLGFHDEKFQTVPLPINSTKNDRLVEIKGTLSFITHATLNLIQVWILNKEGLRENWIKRYSINRFYDITGFVPLCAWTTEIFFKRRGNPLLHIYNIEAEEMQEVNVGDVQIYMPHVKSLVSWDSPQGQWDV